MGRRYVLTLLGGAAVWPLVARAQQSVGAGYVRALEQAKRDYGKISKPSEAARSAYITRLVRLREQATRLKSETCQAIDAEIKELSRLILGKWQSPRHDYLYRADGTWTMLPADPDTTHGTWRIDGNQYFDTAATDPPQTSQYTIILISSRISCLPTKRTFFMRCALNRAVVLASCQWMLNSFRDLRRPCRYSPSFGRRCLASWPHRPP